MDDLQDGLDTRHLTPSPLDSLTFTVSSPAADAIKSVDVADIAQNTQMIATSSGDFGGMLFPVVGLTALGGVILALAPPLADE